jgi:hypothetical protein
MGMHIFEYSSFESVVFYHTCDEKSGESDSVIIEINLSSERNPPNPLYQGGVFSKVMPDKKWSKLISSRIQIALYSDLRTVCQIDDTEFASLASYSELESIEVDILPTQCCELRDTQSSRVDTL